MIDFSCRCGGGAGARERSIDDAKDLAVSQRSEPLDRAAFQPTLNNVDASHSFSRIGGQGDARWDRRAAQAMGTTAIIEAIGSPAL